MSARIRSESDLEVVYRDGTITSKIDGVRRPPGEHVAFVRALAPHGLLTRASPIVPELRLVPPVPEPEPTPLAAEPVVVAAPLEPVALAPVMIWPRWRRARVALTLGAVSAGGASAVGLAHHFLH